MESFIDEFKDDREKNSDIIIAIDGMAAAGKGTVARFIADKLNIEHFSASDVFYQVADERNLEDHELSEEAEKELDLEIDRRTLERALEQDCIVEGRIPCYAVGSFADLKIKIKADPSERARRLAGREDIEIEESEKIVEKRDREDSRRYKEYYGINTSDTEIYDIVIDNTDLSINKQNKLVLEELEKLFPEKV
ncbi:MAG: cytidylate kinase family protein [Nanohaloarchaea archaeon]|nr:cytidylate kinase family protein [Candidatus Nanohaloarchaea archaeon]